MRSTPENFNLRDLLKALRPVITSNERPYLQMKSVGAYRMSGREKEGKDGADVIN